MAVNGLKNRESITLWSLPVFFPSVANVDIEYIDMPQGVLRAGDNTVDVKFSRALIPPETFLISDIRLDGIDGVVVKSVDVSGIDSSLYHIVVSVPVGQHGELSITIFDGPTASQ